MTQLRTLPPKIVQRFSPSVHGTLQARFRNPVVCRQIEHILALIGVSYKTQIVHHRLHGPRYQVTLFNGT